MTILAEIFRREELQSDPPVLVDIGASGTLHRRWRAVAPHSVCLAFEPDSRRFGLAERQSTTFKKLLIYHAVAGYRKRKHERFFLTSSPYCSSLLLPNEQSLRRWAFADKFRVEHTLNAMNGRHSLREYLLSWVFATIVDQHGFALEIAQSAEERFHDPLLVRMALSSRRSIMRTVFSGRLVLTAKEKLLKWLGLAE